MEILSTFSAEDLLSEDIFLVILNGTAIGKVRRPQVYDALVLFKLYTFFNVLDDNEIFLFCTFC